MHNTRDYSGPDRKTDLLRLSAESTFVKLKAGDAETSTKWIRGVSASLNPATKVLQYVLDIESEPSVVGSLTASSFLSGSRNIFPSYPACPVSASHNVPIFTCHIVYPHWVQTSYAGFF